ncbi:MAG TPA: YceI family protein [Pyrinomonadaceae bacterium]|nr:YceI family protein [Pyrinomonadaceae bacterium]
MKIFAVLVIALAVFTAACEDPAANKPKATTSEPTNASSSSNSAATATSPAAKGEALALNPENSNVEFTGSKVTGKHDGGFEKFTGTIDLVNAKPEESSVKVDIEMASVVTDASGLTDHLKTGDFFEVEKFPRSTFASTKIVADTAKGANAYTVTGDLEMRGVKKSITFPATITVSDADVAVKAEFAINRKEFGIVYAGKADDLIRDDVVLRLDLKSPRKK